MACPWLVDCLRYTSVTAAGLFAGGALYINLVEQPSRVNLPVKYQRQQWKQSFNLAAFRLPSIGLLSSACATAVYFLDDVTDSAQVRWWLLAPVTFILGGVWTATVMLPDIKILLDDDVIDKKGESWVKNAIATWTTRHGMRTFLDCFVFFTTTCLIMFRRT